MAQYNAPRRVRAAYAPEPNPVEAVCLHLKQSLANLTKRNLSQLAALVKTRLKQLQYRPGSSAASWPRPVRTSLCNPHH